MLFVDRDFITAEDLAAFHSTIGNIAADASVQLEGERGVIRRTIEKAGGILQGRLVGYRGGVVPLGGNPAHVAAIYNGSTVSGGFRAYLHQIVVSASGLGGGDYSPLKTWIAALAIRDAARAAINRNIDDDRFADSFALWNQEAKDAFKILEGEGVRVVIAPLFAPAAVRVPGAGTWGNSNLSVTGSAGSHSPGTVYVAITFTGSAYTSVTVKGNAESAGSTVASQSVTTNDRVVVDKTSVKVPTLANQPAALASMPRTTPTGWNVYAGVDPADLYLQNSAPIAIATETYNLDSLSTTGALLESGQHEDGFVVIPNRILPG